MMWHVLVGLEANISQKFPYDFLLLERVRADTADVGMLYKKV